MRDIKIIYEGVDIYPDVSVNTCFHDMYAEKRSDSLTIRFNDTRKLWDIWTPVKGDIINVESDAADTGDMFVYSITPENGLQTLRAFSMPPAAGDKNNKAWESVRLPQIGQEIAARHNLAFEQYGVENQFYRYIKQENQSDFSFLQERCMLESCAFLVYDGTLIMYSEPYIENSDASGTVIIGSASDYKYENNSGFAYGSCELESGGYQGKFSTPNDSNRVLRQSLSVQVGSNAEADRFAKSILRNINKFTQTGVIWSAFLPGLAAGSMVDLQTEGADSWNENVFIHHIRHDYVNEKSKLFFRLPLEGY